MTIKRNLYTACHPKELLHLPRYDSFYRDEAQIHIAHDRAGIHCPGLSDVRGLGSHLLLGPCVEVNH